MNSAQHQITDPFDLNRFLGAQAGVYERALGELKRGRKQSHWMWFIFPQIRGLGNSSMTQRYSIKSIEEAQEYLAHPVLGKRLIDCTEAVLAAEGRTSTEIMGSPDDLKLKSSMTLFEAASGADSVFGRVLDKFYAGERDAKTLTILKDLRKTGLDS